MSHVFENVNIDVSAEKCAAYIQDTLQKIELTENASLMRNDEKITKLKALYILLDLWIEQFQKKIDQDRSNVSNRGEQASVEHLFVRTLDMIDVERLPGRRMIAA